MEPMQQVQWRGASGENYRFDAYAVNQGFDEQQTGVFIIARAAPGGWEAVYIGQGELKSEVMYRLNDHAVMDKLPTHIHIHKNGAESSRRAIAADLLAEHTEAFEPHGCNVRF